MLLFYRTVIITFLLISSIKLSIAALSTQEYLKYNQSYLENHLSEEQSFLNPKVLLGFSSISFTIAYLGSLGTDLYIEHKFRFYENLLPGIGPFIAYFRYDSIQENNARLEASYKTAEKSIFLISGIIQLASIVNIAISLYTIYHPELKPQEVPEKEQIKIKPIGTLDNPGKLGEVGLNIIYKF